MTKEERELVLKDLSARLPYGVKLNLKGQTHGQKQTISFDTVEKLWTIWIDEKNTVLNSHELSDNNNLMEYTDNCEIKPYLRPMSSMTEEEMKELKQEHVKDMKMFADCLTKSAAGDDSERGKVITHYAADWCNKNHFDYRRLIEKGLALEAPEDMYK